jgi:AraC-like DNA-binding protein
MLLVEAALRGGAVALLLLLSILSLRNAKASSAARYGALFSLGAAAYVIESAPDAALQHAGWLVPIRLLSIGTPAIFWLWACAHFDDDFVPSWRKFLPWLGLMGFGAVALSVDRGIVWRVLQIASLTLVALGLWRALAGRAIDLVENRRRLRLWLCVAAGGYIAAVNLCFLLPQLNPAVQPGGFLNAAGLTAMAFLFATLLLWPAPAAAVAAGAPPEPVATARLRARGGTLDEARDGAVLAALRRLMETDRLYREPGLGIAALAARLEVPEYRLRRLINHCLGHRNFSAFVNGYRLAEVAGALSDPSQAEVPILTIALDAGFQSLGPFNRAFKAYAGVTPSEFRRRALAPPETRAAE